MRNLISLFSAGTLFVANPAFASDWLYIASDTNGSDWYIDLDSIQTTGALRNGWVRVDASSDATVSYYTKKTHFKINCRARTYRLLSRIEYDQNDNVVTSDSRPDYGGITGMNPIAPDTMAEATMEAVCQ